MEMEAHHQHLPVLLERRRGRGGAAEIDSSISEEAQGKHMLWPGLLGASICWESFTKIATKLKLSP